MGLDLLLGAVDSRDKIDQEMTAKDRIRTILDLAIDEDEKENTFEAYHLYRRVMEVYEKSTFPDSLEIKSWVSQAFNNAAIILFEANRIEKAKEFFEKAIEIYPENQTARENLWQSGLGKA